MVHGDDEMLRALHEGPTADEPPHAWAALPSRARGSMYRVERMKKCAVM